MDVCPKCIYTTYAYIIECIVIMDIFLTKMHPFASEGLYEPLGAVWITFMMDGNAYSGFKISVTIHSHYKAWKS